VNDSTLTLLTIAGMAAITLVTRIVGLWLMELVPTSKRLEVWLEYLPGTILAALVASIVISGGIADSIAALLTGLTAWKTKNLLISLIVGVFSVWLLRTII